MDAEHLIKAAVGLARQGFRVHPCRPSDKRPLLDGWPSRATTDVATIRDWWQRWPQANIGVATGGDARLLVVDVDPDKGGRVALREIEGEFSVPATIAVTTPRGGVHLWLQVPPDRPLPGNSAGKLGPGIDTRCEGGFVLCPPSTVLGRPYCWFKRGGNDIVEAPGWLLDRLEGSSGNGERTPPEEWLALATAGVEEGQRNASVARLAGKLFRHLPPADAELAAELVACWNAVRSRPPLGAEELRRTLDSIAAAELRRRGLSQ